MSVARISALLIVALLASSCAWTTTAAAEVTYTFGVNFGLNASEAGSLYELQYETYLGYLIWVDYWNNFPASERTTAWGDTFKVNLHVEQFSNYANADASALAELLWTYGNMSANSSIDYMFGSTAFNGIPLRQYCYDELGRIGEFMVFPLESSEPFYAVPGSFGAVSANILSMTYWLPYLRVAQDGAKIAMLAVLDGTYQSEMCGGVSDLAPQNDLSIVFSQWMPFDWGTLGQIEGIDNRSAVWDQTLETVKALNPDAVVICDYGYGKEYALNWMRKSNWLPKMVVLSPLFSVFEDPSLLDYVLVPSDFNAAAKYVAQPYFTNSKGYNQVSLDRFGMPATSTMAEATLAGMLYCNALVTSPTNQSKDLINTMRLTQYSSFMGVTQFDVHNRQIMPTLITQLLESGNVSHVVGPAQASVDALIYPMPTWSERVFAPKWGSRVEIAAVVLMAIGGCTTLACLVFLIVHWKHRVIVAASPLFCLSILIGGVLVYVSVFTWMPSLISNSMCSLRVWLLPLGFMTMFGSLIAKTERIHRLYNTRGIDIIIISNLQVALRILIVVVIQAIISILMITVANMHAEIKMLDQYRVSLNYWVCTFPTAVKALFGINIGYAFILLVYGTYLAYRIRRVPIAIFDESKVIGFSIYNVAFFGAIVIVIHLAIGNTDRDVTFMLTAICCFVGTSVTTCTLFAAKWYAIYNSGNTHMPNSKSSAVSSGRALTSSNPSSSSGDKNTGKDDGDTSAKDEKIAKLQKRNAQQKKQLAALKSRVAQLEALARDNGLLKSNQDSTGSSEAEMDEVHRANGK